MKIIAIINDKKADTEILLKSLAGKTGDYIRVYSLEDTFNADMKYFTMDNVIPLNLKKRHGKIVPHSFSAMPILRDLMDENFDEILLLRGTMIARKSLSGIWDRLKHDTLKARIYPIAKGKKTMRFQIGVIALSNGPYTYRFISNVIEKIKREPYYKREPFIFFEEIPKNPDMNFIRMDILYNDIMFLEKAAIWHHKGQHFAGVLFEKEYKRIKTGEGEAVRGV